MNDALRLKFASYGVWTYRSAWAMEIMAAIIGLATGILLGVQAFKSNESAQVSDLILASAPFFMVALAEMSKIPIATLLFSANWVWKPILTVLLLLLAGITFETVFMGMERSTTLRQLAYQELVKSKNQVVAQMATLEENLKSTEQDHPALLAQQNVEQVTRLAQNERQSITLQIADVDKELEGKVLLSPDAIKAQQSLNEAEDRRKGLIAEQSAEIKDASNRFESQRDSYVKRINSAGATEEQKNRWAKELSALVNPVPTLKAKFAGKTDVLDGEIDKFRKAFEELRSKSTGNSTAQRAVAETRRNELLQTLDASAKKWSIEKDSARVALSDAQLREAERTQKLIELKDQQQALLKQLADIEAKRIPQARLDQVQRIASRFYGKNPEDIGPEQSSLVALIWFSSLAALAALAGPVTAIVALGLQRVGLTSSAEKNHSKTSRLLRRLLLSWRWRRTQTKIVTREVPVEKLVEKIVEVPVERIIKEILYIPILTDDPEAVRAAMYKDLPKEVADVVKISLKNPADASPA